MNYTIFYTAICTVETSQNCLTIKIISCFNESSNSWTLQIKIYILLWALSISCHKSCQDKQNRRTRTTDQSEQTGLLRRRAGGGNRDLCWSRTFQRKGKYRHEQAENKRRITCCFITECSSRLLEDKYEPEHGNNTSPFAKNNKKGWYSSEECESRLCQKYVGIWLILFSLWFRMSPRPVYIQHVIWSLSMKMGWDHEV